MGKRLAMIEVRGKRSGWCVAWHASKEQIEDMRADGLEVGIVENIVPAWVAEAGLARPWCFVQDLWNFKNPFRS